MTASIFHLSVVISTQSAKNLSSSCLSQSGMELSKKIRIYTYFYMDKQEYQYSVDCREQNTKLKILGYGKLNFIIFFSSTL